MNVKVKPFFVATSCAAVLFATTSQASPEIKQSDLQLSINQNHSYKLTTIKLDSNNLLVSYQLNRSQGNQDNSPFIKLASQEVAEYMPLTSTSKGNQLFELATLFNDKLQQILAFFNTKSEPVTAKKVNKPQPSTANCHS